jgi:ribosome-associated toxin RatA of RatAB toxin-antitoxin module
MAKKKNAFVRKFISESWNFNNSLQEKYLILLTLTFKISGNVISIMIRTYHEIEAVCLTGMLKLAY